MIEDAWRYFAPGGALMPGGPSTWHILDWDQRRIIAVTMDEVQDSEDVAIEHLKKHIDALGPDVYAIHLSPNGDLISVSTNPDDDETFCVHHPSLEEVQRPGWVQTVSRSELREQERLSPNVDLVSYAPFEGAEPRKVVFKYYFLVQFFERRWDEMNLWMSLCPHPNIVQFDRLVVDKLDSDLVVVGFTSLYIPGGTIAENKSRVFKLEWLKQLTAVVDDMNLKHGIMHQDIATRNLLVDPKTDAILLFDFNYSARIGGVEYSKARDDVKGVIFTLYEIITGDEHFRDIPHEEQSTEEIEALEEWVKHPGVSLDHPVAEYRSVLNHWVKQRREGRQITSYTEAPEYIDWPAPEGPPSQGYTYKDQEGNSVTIPFPSWANSRRS